MQAFLKTGKLGPQPSTSDKAKPAPAVNTPWVEKYRPKNVDAIVEQTEVVNVLRESVNGSDLPNLLLYGPPGTGKTSTILAAARQLFGDIYRSRILELNASDERGINVIRTKVKNFAQRTASGTRPDGTPCPPFKIIILDEADSMTHAAQAALRRTMEKESRSTRFCLVCNYVSKIIEPITSRCTKFRFKPLSSDKIIVRLREICEAEKVPIEDSAYQGIVDISGGDMRRAITLLQSCYRLKGNNADTKILEEDIFEISGIIPMHFITDFIDTCRTGDYKKLEEYIKILTYEAYNADQLFEQLNEYLVRNPELTSNQKAQICDKLGKCCEQLQDGGSEYLQMIDLGCTMLTSLKA